MISTDESETRPRRPFITYTDGRFKHNGDDVRVVMSKGLIRVGCSEMSIQAAEKLVETYRAKFPKDEVFIIQP